MPLGGSPCKGASRWRGLFYGALLGETMGCHGQLPRKLILAAYLEGYLGLRGVICAALAVGVSVLEAGHVKRDGARHRLGARPRTPQDATVIHTAPIHEQSGAMNITLCTRSCAGPNKDRKWVENGIFVGAL